jgi:hypothetical protein
MLSKAATASFDALRLLRMTVAAASKHDGGNLNDRFLFLKWHPESSAPFRNIVSPALRAYL